MPVEDFVRGKAPDVSVVSGKATGHRVTVAVDVPDDHSPKQATPEPLQRVLALVKARLRAPIVLEGRLPMTEFEEARHRRQMLFSKMAVAAGVGALVLVATVAAAWSGAAALACLAVIAVGAVSLRRAGKARPGGRVDGEREWVTLTPVHPAFARAARERYGVPLR